MKIDKEAIKIFFSTLGVLLLAGFIENLLIAFRGGIFKNQIVGFIFITLLFALGGTIAIRSSWGK